MNKVKLIMAIALVFALGAGAVAGYVGATRLPPHEPSTSGPPGARDRETDLARELKLSDAQREQMRKIWSEAMQNAGRERGDKVRTIQKERDDAIVALLTPEQKQQYEKIMSDYRDKMDAMNTEREKAFARAVQQTNEILDTTQRLKYAEIRKRRMERGGWGRRGATTQSATQPTTRP